MPILLDASYWVALANDRDVHHKLATSLASKIAHEEYGKAVTSDYIFDESLAVALRKRDHKTACDLGDLILNSEIIFIRIDEHLFEDAWNFFLKQDFNFSFTDCTNLSLMRSLGIGNIATFDKEFVKVKGINVIS